ncbi:MAG: ABC transporter permease subunit [Solirubrobacteraceae bacterium]|nr:ABC transporter permease subunit [Solirubrobacteraceae bacterium]
MPELVRHLHRRRLRSTIIWGLSIALTSALMAAAFTAIDPAAMESLTKTVDPKLLEAFGSTPESFSSADGFMAGKLLSYMPLILGFFPILMASRGIAGAEADGSLDVLVTQPIPRWQIPASLFIASVIGLVEILVIYVVGTELAVVLTGIDLSLGKVVTSAIGLIPISLAFGALALMLSARVRKPGEVTGIAGGVLVASYLLNTIVLILPDLDDLKILTAFHWYGSPIERGLDGTGTAVLLVAAALFAAASIPLFNRRDILA